MAIPAEITLILADLVRDMRHNLLPPDAIVLRGLPGSGKTFLADNISTFCRHAGLSCRVCSADSWFSRDGRYRYVGGRLHEAHDHSKGIFLLEMVRKTRVIVVDNTNLETRHYMWYKDQAVASGYRPQIVEFDVHSSEEALIVTSRSLHVTDVEHYDPCARWWTFESDGEGVIRVRPPGIGRDAGEVDQEVLLENHRRGYV